MIRVHLPTTLDEFWNLQEREPAARVYAGGTDLLVQLRHGLMIADSLICIERLEEIKGVKEERDHIVIGAGTTHARILESDIICKHVPILVQALEALASPPIRHMGTIGGNIVNASPAGDTLPPLYVLKASVEISSRDNSRSVPVERFIRGPGNVDLADGELLTAIRIPKSGLFSLHHFEKIGHRKSQACAIASMAALGAFSPDGIVEDLRLAWGSVGPTVMCCTEAEKILKGLPLTQEKLEEAARVVREAVAPIDDIRAGSEYRRAVAGNLLLRLIEHGPHST